MRQIFVEPITLRGEFASLEPISLEHAESLARHVAPDIYEWMAADMPRSNEISETERYIRTLLVLEDTVAFAIREAASQEYVGVTTYMDIRPAHLGLEIGRTWVAPEFQATAVNPQCKLLLLEHAFEKLGCERVQLKTDARNLQSQRAIEKLGAKKEGVLRKHMVMPDGYVRDTVMYSIIPAEWPKVKAGLEARLAAFRSKQPAQR